MEDAEMSEENSTLISSVTNVIVKASPVIQSAPSQRSESESVLVISARKVSEATNAQASPVIVKNTNPSVLQSNAFVITSGVIRSTKSEEYRLSINQTSSLPSTSSSTSNEDPDTELDNHGTNSPYDDSIDAEQSQTSPRSSPYSRTETPDSGRTSVTQKRDNPRDARNKAEKERRDKFNSSINQLATLVQLVAESPRKIDKTGVLRLTAHELRKEHVFGDSIRKKSHMDPPANAAEALVELMGGFFITVTCRGIIIIVTSNIEQYLGHCHVDLLGNNILNFTHPDDVEMMKNQLMPRNIPLGPNGQLLLSQSIINSKHKNLKDDRRHFHIRLARATQRSESPQYEMCRIDGSFRIADKANCNTACQVIRRHRSRDDHITPSGNDVVFMGMVRMSKTGFFSEMLIEAAKMEYKTRHLVDGRIVQCDQRISLVAGYLMSEVSGVSAFTFMHKDDVRWVIIALRQMYDRNTKFGESSYRLITRTGEFIYLRTRGYLEINSSNNAVESFVCINTLVTDEIGKALTEEMKKKYSVLIELENDYPITSSSGEARVEDPHQVEQAIMHLITNLPSPGFARSPSPTPDAPLSLSIIPPKQSTIKTTIAKSVCVINQAIKHKKNDNSINKLTYDTTFTPIMDDFPRPSQAKSVNSVRCKGLSNAAEDIYNLLKPSTSRENRQKQAVVAPKEIERKKEEIVVDNTLLDIDKNLDKVSDLLNIPSQDSISIDNITGCEDFFSFNENDKSLYMGLGDRKESSVKDPLLNTFHGVNIEQDFADLPSTSSTVFVNPMEVLKRKSYADDSNGLGCSKRKVTCDSADLHSALMYDIVNEQDENLQIKEELPDMLYPLDVLEIPNHSFETYIEQLTNPRADLSEVLPRSLAALENNITQMDEDVHSNNTQNQPIDQQNDMLTDRQQQKMILGSIRDNFDNVLKNQED